MLYVYYGEDVEYARAKARATIDALQAKNPEALYIRITEDTITDFDMSELVTAQALFKNEYIVLLDRLLGSDATYAQVNLFLAEYAESPNLFFMVEEKLKKPVIQKLEKTAQKIQYFEKNTQKQAEQRFNIFALTDALGERNKKKLWILFWQAKHAGISDEEIHGTLFWMVKAMQLAQKAESPEEAGLKPFVFNKARRYGKNFSSQALDTLTGAMTAMPHTARRLGVPLHFLLETQILRV